MCVYTQKNKLYKIKVGKEEDQIWIWIDSAPLGMSLDELSRAIEEWTLWTHSFIEWRGVGVDSTACHSKEHFYCKSGDYVYIDIFSKCLFCSILFFCPYNNININYYNFRSLDI